MSTVSKSEVTTSPAQFQDSGVDYVTVKLQKNKPLHHDIESVDRGEAISQDDDDINCECLISQRNETDNSDTSVIYKWLPVITTGKNASANMGVYSRNF